MSRRTEQRRKHASQRADNDLRTLMETAEFRRFLQRCIDDAGIDTVSPFTGNSATFHLIGKQDFVRGLVQEARRVALPAVRRMEDETLAERTRAEAERELDIRDDNPEA